MGDSRCCLSVCTLVDRYYIKCIYHPSPCFCPLSCPACRVLQGKSIRGPRWAGVSPLQGERGMFQWCQRGGSIIVIILLIIVTTAAAHKCRCARVESASLSQEAAILMGAAVIPSPGSVYLAAVNRSAPVAGFSCLRGSPVNICSVALIVAPWSINLGGGSFVRKDRRRFARRVDGANTALLLSPLHFEFIVL